MLNILRPSSHITYYFVPLCHSKRKKKHAIFNVSLDRRISSATTYNKLYFPYDGKALTFSRNFLLSAGTHCIWRDACFSVSYNQAQLNGCELCHRYEHHQLFPFSLPPFLENLQMRLKGTRDTNCAEKSEDLDSFLSTTSLKKSIEGRRV